MIDETKLDPRERRLVEAARRACSDPGDDLVLLRYRVRNRAETYRELARRARFEGAAAQVTDVEARKALFEALLDELDEALVRLEGQESDRR